MKSDDLVDPLTINPTQDNVIIRYKCNSEWFEEEWYSQPLIYGYENSKTRTPKAGQSIAASPRCGLYSITNMPSIGFKNDTTGMMGTIKGTIYDKDGLPLSYMNERGLQFGYCGYFFYPQSDGSYSTRYYSLDNNGIDLLFYDKIASYPYHTVSITPINFSMQPDSVVICDIYLTGEIESGINEINSDVFVLKIYPQPVEQQSFNYEISIPIKSLETYMIVRNITGQEICKFSVMENKGTIVLPENIKTGSYILQLISNKKKYATTKLIVK